MGGHELIGMMMGGQWWRADVVVLMTRKPLSGILLEAWESPAGPFTSLASSFVAREVGRRR